LLTSEALDPFVGLAVENIKKFFCCHFEFLFKLLVD
jgi:hypothetical protein